jgi:hypothetical protein
MVNRHPTCACFDILLCQPPFAPSDVSTPPPGGPHPTPKPTPISTPTPVLCYLPIPQLCDTLPECCVPPSSPPPNAVTPTTPPPQTPPAPQGSPVPHHQCPAPLPPTNKTLSIQLSGDALRQGQSLPPPRLHVRSPHCVAGSSLFTHALRKASSAPHPTPPHPSPTPVSMAHDPAGAPCFRSNPPPPPPPAAEPRPGILLWAPQLLRCFQVMDHPSVEEGLF